MVARRAIALVCVTVLLITAWVPAVAWGSQGSTYNKPNSLHDTPAAPAMPVVFDQIDPVIPSPEKIEPAPGYGLWLIVRAYTALPVTIDKSWRCFIASYPDTLQELHCLLSV